MQNILSDNSGTKLEISNRKYMEITQIFKN